MFTILRRMSKLRCLPLLLSFSSEFVLASLHARTQTSYSTARWAVDEPLLAWSPRVSSRQQHSGYTTLRVTCWRLVPMTRRVMTAMIPSMVLRRKRHTCRVNTGAMGVLITTDCAMSHRRVQDHPTARQRSFAWEDGQALDRSRNRPDARCTEYSQGNIRVCTRSRSVWHPLLTVEKL